MCLIALVLRHYSSVDLNDKEEKKNFITDKSAIIESILKAEKLDPSSDLKIQSVITLLI